MEKLHTLGDLFESAIAKLKQGRPTDALFRFYRLLELEPGFLDARLGIADALQELGKQEEAYEAYSNFAEFAAQLGYPLRALVALHSLENIGLQDSSAAKQQGTKRVAELYGSDSQKLGRGARTSLPSLETPLRKDFVLGPALEQDVLIQEINALLQRSTEQGFVSPSVFSPIPLFSLLPTNAFATVTGMLRLNRAASGSTIIEQGDLGDSLFVIVRGSVDVIRTTNGKSMSIATLHDGALFGETALLAGAPRSATVIAKRSCDILELPREALLNAASSVDTIAQALAQFCQDRLLRGLLATAKLFSILTPKQRQDLLARFVLQDLPAGKTLIEEGQPGAGLFVLLRGKVAVRKNTNGNATHLAELSPGEVFGEIALIDDRPTTATVTTIEPSGILFLHKKYFQRLMVAVPDVREYIENLGTDRLLETQTRLPNEDPFTGAETPIII